jgi:hypothetical protein
MRCAPRGIPRRGPRLRTGGPSSSPARAPIVSWPDGTRACAGFGCAITAKWPPDDRVLVGFWCGPTLMRATLLRPGRVLQRRSDSG